MRRQGVNPSLESIVSQHARLVISTSALQTTPISTQTTALLSLHGPRTTTSYLAKYFLLLTRPSACSRLVIGEPLPPWYLGLSRPQPSSSRKRRACLRATIHRKRASDQVCVTRTNQPVAATLLCRAHPQPVRTSSSPCEGCLGAGKAPIAAALLSSSRKPLYASSLFPNLLVSSELTVPLASMVVGLHIVYRHPVVKYMKHTLLSSGSCSFHLIQSLTLRERPIL